MPTCTLCPDSADHPPGNDAADTLNHLRLMHPDVDAEPERWPDGRPVVVDLTLDPDDFKEDA